MTDAELQAIRERWANLKWDHPLGTTNRDAMRVAYANRHAPTDIAALLAEVERLRDENAALRYRERNAQHERQVVKGMIDNAMEMARRGLFPETASIAPDAIMMAIDPDLPQ